MAACERVIFVGELLFDVIYEINNLAHYHPRECKDTHELLIECCGSRMFDKISIETLSGQRDTVIYFDDYGKHKSNWGC